MSISVYILTYNEEDKIRDALSSVMDWADEVVVADSFSTDRTVQIAAEMGATVVPVRFEGFGKLRNDALAATTHGWIFSLDADERCTPEARDEILRIVSDPTSADAWYVPRRNFFMGREIRHSGWYPDYRQPQLFRRGAVTYHDDAVHEGYTVHGSVGHMKSAIVQIPFKNIEQLIRKMDSYSTLGAKKLAVRGARPAAWRAPFHALAAFLKFYLIKRGFLDGLPGLVIAFQNMEYAFYKYVKQVEDRRLRGDAEGTTTGRS